MKKYNTEQYDLVKEQWKWIKGFQNLYAISDLGRCKRIYKNGKVYYTLGGKAGEGYLYIALCKEGKVMCTPRVHDLVFQTFYRRLLPNEIVHHLSKVKTQNQKTNLVARDKSTHQNEHHKGTKHSQQSKQKTSKKLKGHFVSQQTKIKISNSMKKLYLLDSSK